MQPPLKAMLFDNDGTLVDSEGSHFQMWAKVLKPYGVFLSEKQYKRYYAGIPSEGNALDMIQRFYSFTRSHIPRGNAVGTLRVPKSFAYPLLLLPSLLNLRLAHHWHWLNDGQYGHVSELVAEIERLVGGWLKQ